ncbi:hypothetical protein A4X03_0g7669 [Tilletia caries]|uniref:protein-serine/threonine phosphatase n=1 Tax=Tilletia caries TaxID=13290 RepID=A0A8T8SLV3_9BASI|nr:hypothetical protein A4X03_0g7669 [Tilletia caries]
MGQTLSEPVIEKHTSADEDATLVYGISEMQGWRISMEDAHATILKLTDADDKDKISFFAVYDGHGGSAVAKYAGKTVHGRLSKLPQFKSGDYEAALKRAFLATDEDLREDAAFANDSSGCTAVAALLVPGETSEAARRIIVANAGDSRSVLSLKGEAKPMSYDHKPTNQKETARIVGAGGFVEFGRVNGNLALSRALGDFEFKGNHSLPPEDQAVTADPDVIVHSMTGEEEFLVLACDGIFDCLSNQQVVDFVRRGIASGKDLSKICEEAMDRCLAPDTDLGGVGSDNMTICVVALLNGRTKKEWYAWVKERVDNNVGWETPDDIAPVFNTNAGGAAGGLGASLHGAGVGGPRRGAGGAGADSEEGGSGQAGVDIPRMQTSSFMAGEEITRLGDQNDRNVAVGVAASQTLLEVARMETYSFLVGKERLGAGEEEDRSLATGVAGFGSISTGGGTRDGSSGNRGGGGSESKSDGSGDSLHGGGRKTRGCERPCSGGRCEDGVGCRRCRYRCCVFWRLWRAREFERADGLDRVEVLEDAVSAAAAVAAPPTDPPAEAEVAHPAQRPKQDADVDPDDIAPIITRSLLPFLLIVRFDCHCCSCDADSDGDGYGSAESSES